MLLVANLANTKKMQETQKDYWNPCKWVLIWEYSARAFKWIPRRQGFNGFSRILHSCDLDESSLSIGRVKVTKILPNSQDMFGCYRHECVNVLLANRLPAYRCWRRPGPGSVGWRPEGHKSFCVDHRHRWWWRRLYYSGQHSYHVQQDSSSHSQRCWDWLYNLTLNTIRHPREFPGFPGKILGFFC